MSPPTPEELEHTATAPGAAATGTRRVSVGTELGRYTLELEVGAGGNGVVYAARDRDLERRVAIKVLHEAPGDAQRARLLREARALARLQHPNVVTVHEVGSSAGCDFVAMEFVDGETLAAWLERDEATPAERLAAYLAAGRGLAAAHAAGLVHRDFKPHNVLRRRDGQILVTDFGLARAAEMIAPDPLEATLPATAATAGASTSQPGSLDGALTATGTLLGTPAYMAPEQWRGQAVGPAADQFAFCVAVWEALVGARPFQGASVEELRAAVGRGLPADAGATLPRGVRAVLARGLAPVIARRWPDMDALLAALARATARPRRRLLAGLAIVGLGLGIATAVGVASLRGGDAEPGAPACTPPARPPDTVWSPAVRAAFVPVAGPRIAALLDDDHARWSTLRASACAAAEPVRGARLACLDAVAARIVATRAAAIQAGSATVMRGDLAKLLIDPEACAQERPPRVPIAGEAHLVDVLALALEADKPAAAASATTILDLATDEPCVTGWARRIRATGAAGVAAATELEEAGQAAERCGDDHLRAAVLVDTLEQQVRNPMFDGSDRATLRRAEIAAKNLGDRGLIARVGIIASRFATAHDRWSESIALGEEAIDRMIARGLVHAAVVATNFVLAIRQARSAPDDEAAVSAALARWIPLATEALGPDARATLLLRARRAMIAWTTEQTAAYPELEAIEAAWRRLPRLANAPDPGSRLTIHGRVVDPDGRPVAGATVIGAVEIVADDHRIGLWSPAYADPPQRAVTDAQGRFQLADVPAAGVVAAEHRESRTRPVAAAADVTLRLAPTTKVAGELVLGPIAANRVTATASITVGRGGFTLLGAVGTNGRFALARVPRGEVVIGYRVVTGASHYEVGGTPVTVGATPPPPIRFAPGNDLRELHVIVRSKTAARIDAAQVFLVPGAVAVTTVRELNPILARGSFRGGVGARVADEDAAPELVRALRRDDLFATFRNVGPGTQSLCVVALAGDLADPAVLRKLQEQSDRLDARCVPVAVDATLVSIEVEPMKRLD